MKARQLVVTMLVALAAGAAGPAVAQTRVVQFGAAVSLTGTLSHEGQRTKDAYEFWKDLVNARGGIKIGGVPHRIEITAGSKKTILAFRRLELLSEIEDSAFTLVVPEKTKQVNLE